MNDRPTHRKSVAEGGTSGHTPRTSAVSAAPATAVRAGSMPITGYVWALENVTAMLLEGRELHTILQAVCIEIRETVPGADMVGVTVLTDGTKHPMTAASTDPRVNDIDDDQYRADEGPCLEAARTRRMVRMRVRDIAARWPQFAAHVADIGAGSYLSAPLAVDGTLLGAINIYSGTEDGFSDTDEALVQLFVTAIEAAVTMSHCVDTAEQELAGLNTAMETRAAIEQAKGIIMALRGVDSEDAFEILSELSQSRNIKLAEIAASLVASMPQHSELSETPPVN